MSSTVTSKDNGANAIVKAMLRAALGAELRVGILEDKGSARAEGDDKLTVADVATFNEFGLGVPERSFIRAWYDEQLEPNKAAFRALQAQVVRGAMTQERMFQLLGLKFQAEIQKRISDGIAPANAPSTIAQKGSSKPLIHTGQLRASITYEVVQ